MRRGSETRTPAPADPRCTAKPSRRAGEQASSMVLVVTPGFNVTVAVCPSRRQPAPVCRGVVMRKLLSIGWIFASLAFCLCAAPAAQAGTIVTAVWEGTIRGGNDAGNHFGGTLAAGTAFSVTSVFDT